MTLWKTHKYMIKVKVGHHVNSKVNLRFKERSSKRHQFKLHCVAETYKKIMKDFLEDSCEQKASRKADAAE